MKEDKKQLIIATVVILAVIIAISIIFYIGYSNSKHQEIAYEQYICEDMRQARIYNVTFAKTEEEFLKKIEDFPEADKVIAKALYEIKPEVEPIKKALKEDLETKDFLSNTINSVQHDILSDSKASLHVKGIDTIEQYVETYDIKGYISPQEYKHLIDMFYTDRTPDEIVAFSNTIKKRGIVAVPSESIPSHAEMEKELVEVNEKIKKNEDLLNTTRTSYNELIAENSIPLEYQHTIKTNGIKTAADYLTSI